MWHLDEIHAQARVADRLAEAENLRRQRAAGSNQGGATSRALRYGRRATGRAIVRAGIAISGPSDAGLP